MTIQQFTSANLAPEAERGMPTRLQVAYWLLGAGLFLLTAGITLTDLTVRQGWVALVASVGTGTALVGAVMLVRHRD